VNFKYNYVQTFVGVYHLRGSLSSAQKYAINASSSGKFLRSKKYRGKKTVKVSNQQSVFNIKMEITNVKLIENNLL
jgi:hypothetical protein